MQYTSGARYKNLYNAKARRAYCIDGKANRCLFFFFWINISIWGIDEHKYHFFLVLHSHDLFKRMLRLLHNIFPPGSI